MPVPILVAAPARELAALVPLVEQNPGLEIAACDTTTAARERLESGFAPLGALVRLSVPPDGGESICRLVRSNPRLSQSTKLYCLLDRQEVGRRDALFQLGVDDTLVVPDELSEIASMLAGTRNEFRRAPRVPVRVRARLECATGATDCAIESMSPFAARIQWATAPPADLVRLEIAWDEIGTRHYWARVEDNATTKGKTTALILRLVGVLPEERAELASILERGRGLGGSVLEPPVTPATFSTAALPIPPPSAPTPPRPSSSGIRNALLALSVAGVAGGGYAAFRLWDTVRHPSHTYVRNAAAVVGGVRYRSLSVVAGRFVGVADASWSDLDADRKRGALGALLAEATAKGLTRAEIYDSSGPAGVATAGTNASVTILH